MTLAHIAWVPVEELLAGFAPAAAAMAYMTAGFLAWLRRR